MTSTTIATIDGTPVTIRVTQDTRHGEAILAAIAAATGVTTAEIKGPDRARHIVAARFDACAALRQSLGWSMPRIGHFLGGRDHTTILNALRKRGVA